MTTSRFCDTCGGALPANATACPFCGAAVAAISSAPTPPPGPPYSLRPITPAPRPSVAPGPGMTLAGRYYLEKKIGEGGFGAVYKAWDWQNGGKVVAVKQINMASLSAQEKIEATDSYNREITLLSVLKHRGGLPHVRDHFTDPEHWYIVMDYIPGRTLEEILTATPGGRLSLAQTVEIGVKLCDVLTYLHDQNPPVIFRDAKPGNIMLTPWGQVYLIDFGIARRYQAGKPRDTMPLGSPGYAAPEQYGKGQSSVQTDIYGLGATLQTLLTGCEPLEIRMHGLPPDCKIPYKLQSLIYNMLDPDPRKRPHEIREVKNALIRSSGTSGSMAVNPIGKFFFLAPALSWVQTIFETHSYNSHLWLVYLLVALGIILARTIYVLLHLRSLAFPAPTLGGLLKIVWQRVGESFYYALILAAFFQGIYVLLHPGLLFGTWPQSGGGAAMSLLFCLLSLLLIYIESRHFWQWWQDRRAARRRTRQQQQALQQQAQNRQSSMSS
jgi:hypothetical protein